MSILEVQGVPLRAEIAAFGSNAIAGDFRQRSRAYEHWMEALIAINVDWIRRFPDLPRLEAANVRYAKDATWRDIPLILGAKIRRTDCKSIVAYRIADLRVRGETGMIVLEDPLASMQAGRSIDPRIVWATPLVSWRRDEKDPNHLKLHVQVRRPDGRVEDPCRPRGMTRIVPHPSDRAA